MATAAKREFAVTVGKEAVTVRINPRAVVNPAHVFAYDQSVTGEFAAPNKRAKISWASIGVGLPHRLFGEVEQDEGFSEYSGLSHCADRLMLVEEARRRKRSASKLDEGSSTRFIRRAIADHDGVPDGHLEERLYSRVTDLLLGGLIVSVTDFEARHIASLMWKALLETNLEAKSVLTTELEEYEVRCKTRVKEAIVGAEFGFRFVLGEQDKWYARNLRQVDVQSQINMNVLGGECSKLEGRVCDSLKVVVDSWTSRESKMTFSVRDTLFPEVFPRPPAGGTTSAADTEFEESSPVSQMSGVGDKTADHLTWLEIHTVGDLLKLTDEAIAEMKCRLSNHEPKRIMRTGLVRLRGIARNVIVSPIADVLSESEDEEETIHLEQEENDYEYEMEDEYDNLADTHI